MEKDWNMECMRHWFKLWWVIKRYACVSVCVIRLEDLVKAFLGDPDPDVTLSLGADMRKIQHCFSLLKVMY